ncbi:Putative baculoviral IAP repeat-containing protein [Podospora comata]|uniref:Baculoviral IAP repeat-containing protein n=1 Tax=Podospora comata TaxID=48703 RepID=A0ABY6S3C5_PODCO|nr:Putative baculoviral IAP repeat-containing protein [Podospora comata]
MPPFKERLGMRMQKVQSIFRPSKRRIAEDDASSQPPKQLRTMLGPTKKAVQYPPSLSAPSTSPAGSSKANELPSTSPSGVSNTLAYPTMPFIMSADPPGSRRGNPIDLDAPPSQFSRRNSSSQSDSSSSSLIYDDDDQRQVLNDEAIARILQEAEHEYKNQPESSPQIFSPVTEEETKSHLAEFREKYHRWKCCQCGKSNDMTADVLVQKTKSMLKAGKSFLGMIHPFTKCRYCGCEGCSACGTRGTSLARQRANAVRVTDAIRASLCCPEGRAFVIFSLLCGYERPTATKISTPASKEQPKQQQKLQPPQHQTAFARGTGYAHDSYSFNPFKGQPQQFHNSKPTPESADAVSYFLTLAEVLPSVDKKEFESTPGLRVMIHASPMMRLACEILRSAAIGEMDARAGIIKAALLFVHSLARNWDAASCIFHEQIHFPPSQQLLMASMASMPPSRQAISSNQTKPETAQSVYTVVEKLSVVCRVFMDGSKSFGSADDGDEAICIARQVCDLQEVLHHLKPAPEDDKARSGPRASASTTSTVVTRSKNKELESMAAAAKMTDYHKLHGVMEIKDDLLLANFYTGYQNQVVNSNGQRMRKLFAQISSLHADLPDGIYVRYGESRPDMLKVLIIGPKNTPYEHGIFLFDILCGSDFPTAPPKVQFLTTGGGKVRFNPNLYANGKVCLSLIGTWNGQGWVPNVSTILQVLVSIQSMIFVERPYYNEPGYEIVPNHAGSEAYDRNIECDTVYHAIMPWLQALGNSPSTSQYSNTASPADCQIWGDIALKHLQLQKPAILAKVREWSRKSSSRVSGSMVSMLEKALSGSLAVPEVPAVVTHAGTPAKTGQTGTAPNQLAK